MTNKRTISDTYALDVYISEEDLYDRLSDEDKKRFNKVIISDVQRDWVSGGVTIKCVVVNDCNVDSGLTEKCSCNLCSDGKLSAYKSR